MRLISLHLSHFGGIVSKKISFGPQITLFIGPNETGKSTLVQAIFHTLLTPVELHKTAWNKNIAAFISLESHAQPETVLDYEEGSTGYRIKKKWPLFHPGQKEKTEGAMTVECLKSGKIVARNQEEFNAILPLHPGTLRSLTLQLQNQEASFHMELASEGELRKSLEEKLREHIFMPSPGFSLAVFKESLEKKITAYHANWNVTTALPEKDRGIHNPWKKNVGTILESYYEWRKISALLKKIQDLEQDLSEAGQKSETLRGNLISLQQQREDKAEKLVTLLQGEASHAKAAHDAVKRAQLIKIRKRWPECSTHIAALTRQILEDEQEALRLEAQFPLAQEKEKLPAIDAMLEAVRQLESELAALRSSYTALPHLDEAGMQRVQDAEACIQEHEIRYRDELLRLRITAREDRTVTLQSGLNKEETFSLDQDAEKEFKDLSSFLLRSPSLNISVEKGNRDLEEDRRSWEAACKIRKELLEKFHADSTAQLLARARKAEELAKRIEEKTLRLKELLQDHSITELQRESARLHAIEAQNAAEIAEARGIVVTRKSAAVSALEELKKEEAGYKEEFESLDQLHAVIDAALQEAEPLQADLFPPKKGEELKKELDTIKISLGEAEAAYEKAKLKTDQLQRQWLIELGPYASREDVERIESTRFRTFQRLEQEGSALRELQQSVEEIEAEAQASMFSPYTERFAEKFSRLSGRRYELSSEGIDMQALKAGESIDQAMLSSGTRSVFALAARLTSLELLLPASSFLVLDDPFIYIDAERQRIIADMLEALSKEHQLLLFSCHEELSSLFTAPHLIRLSTRI